MRFLSFATLLFTLFVVAQVQPKAPVAARPFLGHWYSTFEGRNFMDIDLWDTDPLSGHIKTGDIEVNAGGKLIAVQEGESDDYTLIDVKLSEGKLTFRTRDDDGDVASFEMKLNPDGKSVLWIRVEGVAIQPLVLVRR